MVDQFNDCMQRQHDGRPPPGSLKMKAI